MRTFSVKDEIAPTHGAQIITIGGDISLDNIGALKQELLAILSNDGAVHLIASRIEKIDLSGLQLLISLKKSLQQENRTVTFDVSYSNDSLRLVECSGYIDLLK
jgi:ABC-type transporter Mla MlaB component